MIAFIIFITIIHWIIFFTIYLLEVCTTTLYNVIYLLAHSGPVSRNVELFVECKRIGNDIRIVRSISIIVSRMRSHWLSLNAKPLASSAIDDGDDAADLPLSHVSALPAITTSGKCQRDNIILYSTL